MANIDNYISAIAVGSKVASITNQPKDAFSSGGYSAFVYSVTGSLPTVLTLPDNRVRLVLTKNQIKKMQEWLDEKALGSFNKSNRPNVEIELGPVVKPWAAKYLLPAGIGILLVGIVTGRVL